MNKPLFTIISILSIFISINISAAANSTTEKPPENQSEQTKSVDKSSDKSVMDTLWPSTKKCNYVDNKQYQPFADITKNFPGVGGLMDKDGCVTVSGATENLIKLLFTSAITVIIILTVVNISISGIRYMTEEAVGKKGEAKKTLTNSLIALALGLASYTILYTVNKQLVQFEFNPNNIDKDGSVDKGLEDTKNTLANISYLSTDADSIVSPIYQVGNPGYNTDPAGADNTNQSNNIVDEYNNTNQNNGFKSDLYAKITSIKNPELMKARASGYINIDGQSFQFNSGGGGEGYLPYGMYKIIRCYIRNDQNNPEKKTMFIFENNEVFGYSCDLSDVEKDPRTGTKRDLLRIHPDGGNPGTIGCIGIVGNIETQKRFWAAVKKINPKTITVTK